MRILEAVISVDIPLTIRSICRKRTHVLKVIGQFVAKAMLDSRIIDLSFNKVFLKLVLGEDVPVTIATLKVRIIRG